MNLKRLTLGFLACCTALILCSCSGGKKASEAIVGKWKDTKDNSVVEFKADGTIVMAQMGMNMNGTYKFSDDTHMKVDLSMPLPPEAKKNMPAGTPDTISMTADCVVAIKGDDMTIDATMNVPGQPPQKDTAHMKRLK